MKIALIILGLLAGALVLFFTGMTVMDYADRYKNFKALDKDHVIREAENYVKNRTQDTGQMACLYVLRCEGNTAHLQRVDDIHALDFAALKDSIWKRRFEHYCLGRTANIALHLIPLPGHEAESERIAQAYWSFYNNRFVPNMGRFHSGAFTDQPWLPCEAEVSLQTQLKSLGH